MSKEATKKFIENNGFICNKCGKVIVDGIKHKNEEDLCDQCKIADLEAKLAECEKKREYLFSSNCDYISQIEELKQQLAKSKDIIKKRDLSLKNTIIIYNNEQLEFKTKIKELKQQLAEKDLRIEELESQFAYECECNKQFVDCQKENENLKQQLEEKEKELKYKTAECEKWKTDYKNCSELEKIMSQEHQYCLDNWRASEQDKISFAVEQLEKVRKILNKSDESGYIIQFRSMNDRLNFYKEFDNQIKQLKEWK